MGDRIRPNWAFGFAEIGTYAHTDKHLGPKEEIGNKGGSLSNRLRAAMA